MQEMTPHQKAQLRIECAKISFTTGSKVGMTKGECLEVAKKIYKFAVGETEESPAQAGTG